MTNCVLPRALKHVFTWVISASCNLPCTLRHIFTWIISAYCNLPRTLKHIFTWVISTNCNIPCTQGPIYAWTILRSYNMPCNQGTFHTWTIPRTYDLPCTQRASGDKNVTKEPSPCHLNIKACHGASTPSETASLSCVENSTSNCSGRSLRTAFIFSGASLWFRRTYRLPRRYKV